MNLEELTISDIMTREPVSLTERTTAHRALAVLEEVGIRHLPIVDRTGALVGVVSQRDLVAVTGSGERRVHLTRVMQRNVVAVTPETPAREGAYLLLHHRIGCVPVVDRDGGLLGIVTDADFVRIAYAVLGGRVPVDQLELEEREAASV